MKTVMIFDQVATEPIKFVVLAGDYRHLQGIYINGDDDEAKVRELSDLLYDDAGNNLVEFLEEFPIEAVKDGASVIVAGFLP